MATVANFRTVKSVCNKAGDRSRSTPLRGLIVWSSGANGFYLWGRPGPVYFACGVRSRPMIVRNLGRDRPPLSGPIGMLV